ncbi:hypothetical protein IC575_002127 [Cucumis melo]
MYTWDQTPVVLRGPSVASAHLYIIIIKSSYSLCCQKHGEEDDLMHNDHNALHLCMKLQFFSVLPDNPTQCTINFSLQIQLTCFLYKSKSIKELLRLQIIEKFKSKF